MLCWAVVVAQLVEWLLPMPEVCGLNPVFGKKLYLTFIVNCIEKTKIKKKRPGMTHFKKLILCTFDMIANNVGLFSLP